MPKLRERGLRPRVQVSTNIDWDIERRFRAYLIRENLPMTRTMDRAILEYLEAHEQEREEVK